VTLDLNNITTVFIYLLSCHLAHVEDTLQCLLYEWVMLTLARGGKGSRVVWSRIKSWIPCTTGMKWRCTRCITGARTKVKCLMLVVRRKCDLYDPLYD
jgi:hypothetical protein